MSEVNIQVAVRIRPLLPKELLRHHCECVKVIPGSAQMFVNPDRLFTFDHAFGPSASQDEVYRACIQPMVRSLLDGYNATVFCYGETGSGKTYTISGGGQDDEGGIIEHVARDVFGYLDEKLKSNEIDVATVHMSYLELYMEEVRDLLDLPTNQKGLNVRDDINGNTVVVGARESAVNSAEELLSLVEMSSAARQTCTTRMNDKSSRSHTVLTILINQQCNNDSNTLCSSKFCLVDLAGSERVKKTGNTGKHFKESIHINTDLLAVGNVIRALSDRALNFCGKTRKSTFIPFRDAKITRLLRDSLGGTSHTLMMTCVNPSSNSLAETLNVLYFASKARHIRNHPAKQPIHTDPKYNQKLARARISELENEVKLLKEVIEEKQMMIKEVALENIGSEDQRGGDIHFKQGEPLQYWMLTQEAAALLAKISSPSPSFKQELQDWQERLTTINHQHPEDGADFSLSALKLKDELNKCKEALTLKEQQKQQKEAENCLLKRQLQILLEENKTYLQGSGEERKCSHLETEHYLEQQMLISRLRNNLLVIKTSSLDAGTYGATDNNSQSVCLRHGCKYENTGRVRSSPPAYSLERVMADFKMRGHILLAENEKKENNNSLLTKQQSEDRDMAEVEEDTVNGLKGLRTNLSKTWTWPKKNSTLNDRTEPTSHTITINQQSTDYIDTKQVRDKEKLKAGETKKQLRDLSVIVGIKKDLIKELVKTEKELKALLKHNRYSKESRDDVLQILLIHGQQIQAQVYSSLQHMKKQRAELQARLKHMEETSNDHQTTNLVKSTGDDLVNKSGQQKTSVEKLPESCWLETEEELELRRRAELQKLKDEQKRRDEVLKHREACAQQINKLEFKMLLSSQIFQTLAEDLRHVSMSLDSLERSSMEMQRGDSTAESQEGERQRLKMKKETLDAQLQDGRVLSVEEEESLVLLEEDCEALDAALEFENICIQERQKRINTNSSSNQSPNTEPDQLTAVIRKIRTLSATEVSELLIKYFNKVVCLRETLQNLHLRCDELELVVREKEMMVNKMDSNRQRLTLDADRRLTQLQRDHQFNIQQLLQKLRVGVSGEELQAGEEKRKYLERELLFYKSSARELKRKLKETGADMAKFAGDQEQLQNTESSTREQDPLVDIKTKKHLLAEEGNGRGTTHTLKKSSVDML
ncbi:kinesin-like protein KIF27 isoform X1 [Takifugu rubripes]|uniref:kinesin-like protein KIF27 isoform X1 n=1 Tax=Takifugu rubripes TaxID=31033 RepID=UPI0011458123|nr:kinesin-like protein KIF27 isoform X1 [Takifugu rubripes]